jgi:hypothetical protein
MESRSKNHAAAGTFPPRSGLTFRDVAEKLRAATGVAAFSADPG